jgi:hypothetical protein
MQQNVKINSGDRFLSLNKRLSGPFPKNRTKKSLFKWIKGEYSAEAGHRFCEFNQRRAERLNIDNWSKADTELALQYIFGAVAVRGDLATLRI